MTTQLRFTVLAASLAKNARVLDLGAEEARGALLLDSAGASAVTTDRSGAGRSATYSWRPVGWWIPSRH